MLASFTLATCLGACAPQLTEADYQRIKVFGPNNFDEYQAYNQHSGRYAVEARANAILEQCRTINDIAEHDRCNQKWADTLDMLPALPGPSGRAAGGFGSTDRVMDAAQAGEERDIVHSAHNQMGSGY